MPLEDFLFTLRSHIASQGPFEPIAYDPAPVTAVVQEKPRRPTPVRGSFLRGDCRDDGSVDISDPITALSALFLGTAVPGCADACDANDDGRVDISDPVFTLGVLFLGQGVLPFPGTRECGPDPSADALRCLAFAGCP
jgi:hypothetical protein